MSPPLVSIITICRNEGERMRATGRSVAGQKLGPEMAGRRVEWIVIDGESTDSTLAELDAFRSSIDVLRSARDSGVYGAQNRGARLASGEWLLFLNGGDEFASFSALASLLAARAGDDSIDLIYGDLLVAEASGAERRRCAPHALSLEWMMRDTLWHPCSLIRSDLFRRVGPYDETYRICADYDFFLRAVTHGRARARHCPHPIARFRADGLSSLPENREAIARERLRAQEACLSPLAVRSWGEAARSAQSPAAQATRLVRALASRCVTPRMRDIAVAALRRAR